MEMKNRISIILIAIMTVFAGCATIDNGLSSSKLNEQERMIVGSWTGRVFKEKYDYILEWEWHAKADKTYVIKLTTRHKNGTVKEKTEEGKWWIKQGKYHEFIPGVMTEPDIYDIAFLDGKYFIYRSVSYDSTTVNPGRGTYYINIRE